MKSEGVIKEEKEHVKYYGDDNSQDEKTRKSKIKKAEIQELKNRIKTDTKRLLLFDCYYCKRENSMDNSLKEIQCCIQLYAMNLSKQSDLIEMLEKNLKVLKHE